MNIDLAEFANSITKDTDPKDLIAMLGKIDHYDSAALVLIYEARDGNINRLIDKTGKAVQADDAGAIAYRDFLQTNLRDVSEDDREAVFAQVYKHIAKLMGDRAEETLALIFSQRQRIEEAKARAEKLVAQWEAEKCG
jgi:hypothetical protein